MNFQKANHSIENSSKSGGKSIGKVIFDKKFSKISVYLTRLSSFLEILKLLSEPFVTRNLWKFKPDFSSNGKCPRLPVWPSLDQSPLHVKTKLIGFNLFHLILSVDTLTSLEANLQNGMIVHLFVKNMEDFAKINAVYKTFLRVNPPAR